MDQEKIGKYISKKRREKNMTQEELAEALGVTNKSISRWENGKNMPDYSLLKPLCNILKICINDLLNGEEVKEKYVYDKNIEYIIKEYNYMKKRDRIVIAILGALILLLMIFGLYKICDMQYNLSTGISSYMNVEINEEINKTKVGTLEDYDVYVEKLDNMYFETFGVNGTKITLKKALSKNKISLKDLKRKAFEVIKQENISIYRYENYEIVLMNKEIIFRPISNNTK